MTVRKLCEDGDVSVKSPVDFQCTHTGVFFISVERLCGRA